MPQLEVFQYATALDLNTGYNNLRISPAIQYMLTTLMNLLNSDTFVSLWACALRVICSKTKVDELLGDTEGVKTYINDILVLIKDRFSKHI